MIENFQINAQKSPKNLQQEQGDMIMHLRARNEYEGVMHKPDFLVYAVF